MKTIVFVLSVLGACSGSTKQWQLDVNFNNPDNWDSGRTPCATDNIIFPLTINAAVLLQTNLSTIKGLVLPSSGQIVLPNDMNLAFDEDAVDPNCDGGDINFVRTDKKSWFDPDNWQDTENMVTVETERVPCEFDSVVFPEGKLFYVGVESSVNIGKMTFSGKDLNTQTDLTNFLNSQAGRMQFSRANDASLTVSGRVCGVTTGCTCGNDGPNKLDLICNQYTCLATSCNNPVKPVGGCCSLCGAILTFEFDVSTFNLEDFKTMIDNTYGQPASSGGRNRRQVDNGEVNIYISKTSEGKIQMVLTDNSVGTGSGQTAINLAQRIQADMQNNLASNGLTSVTIKSSQKGTGTHTSGSLSGGAKAGIVIAVIIIVILVSTVAFIIIRRRSLFFLKDQPLHADMEIAPDIPASFMEEVPGQSLAMHMQSFENPVYAIPSAQENMYADPTRVDVELTDVDTKKGKKKSKNAKGLPPETLKQQDGIAGFDNPNYGTVVIETGIDDDTGGEPEGAKGGTWPKQESES